MAAVCGAIDAVRRADAEPGAPGAYVTTKRFLEMFGLGSPRDLPDVERFEAEGLLQKPRLDLDFDEGWGILEEDQRDFKEDMECDGGAEG